MSDQPVYMVSGFMRTGTSMMMQCLSAGGLDAAHRNRTVADDNSDEFYHPNAGGVWELHREDYQAHDFPDAWRGRLIKCLGLGLMTAKPQPGGIRCVYMRRDYEEIFQSHHAFFQTHRPITKQRIRRTVERALAHGHNRKDMRLMEVWYRDLITNPLESFENIAEGLDLPIDVRAAAAQVDTALCHYRKEELAQGVIG